MANIYYKIKRIIFLLNTKVAKIIMNFKYTLLNLDGSDLKIDEIQYLKKKIFHQN